MNSQNTDLHAFVVARLRAAMPKNWPAIATQSGVPEDTLRKIAYRETTDPRISSVQKLANHFFAVDDLSS